MTWQERRIVTFLSAVLAVLCAVVLVLLGVRYKENRAAKETFDPAGAVTVTDPTAYTALSYENSEFSLSFALDETGKWFWTAAPMFPLDATTSLGITGQLEARAERNGQRRAEKRWLRPAQCLPYRHHRQGRDHPALWPRHHRRQQLLCPAQR